MELRVVANNSPRQTHERRDLLISNDLDSEPLAERGAGYRQGRPRWFGPEPLRSNRSSQILTIMHHAKGMTREDAPRLHALRREALYAEPKAFGSSPDDCRFRELAAVEACLTDPNRAVFAIADPDQPERLVAMAGIMRETRKKQQHRSGIWGVYVSHSHRGRGFGRAVVEACVDHARTWTGVESVALSVSAEGTEARALYESLGFVTWGTESDSLRIDGLEVSQHHMTLKLSQRRQ